jgi:CubicO group peptidase (beta-lactamase class C family)
MADLTSVVEQAGKWPVGVAAAAAVGPSGVLASTGPVNRQFPLASVTKPLAVLSALVAVEEGALELTDTANEDLVPGATVRHLMSHASGLAPDELRRMFPLATRRVYSHVGIELLADLVARAVDMPFGRYFHESLVRPLGLRDTHLEGSPARDGVASVEDLAQVVAELLEPSGWLHSATLSEAASVQYPGIRGVLPGYGSQNPNDWGLGFEIRSGKQPHWTGTHNSPSTYGHFGLSGSMFWVDPERRIGLVALADRSFGDWAKTAWPALSDAVLAAA